MDLQECGKKMNAVQIELLEEYKYVDSICRDMLSAEKGVTAYIEQMEATQPVVRYKIVGWDDDYRKLKHIRWLRNKIAHSTGNVECTSSDVAWLKAFHSRLLTQRDPLSDAYRITPEAKNHVKVQTAKTTPVMIAHEDYSYNPDSSSRWRKSLIAIVSVAALAVIAGVIIWLLKLSMEW